MIKCKRYMGKITDIDVLSQGNEKAWRENLQRIMQNGKMNNR
jgi:hypothetical protein